MTGYIASAGRKLWTRIKGGILPLVQTCYECYLNHANISQNSTDSHFYVFLKYMMCHTFCSLLGSVNKQFKEKKTIRCVIKKKLFILALKPYTLAVNFHTTPTIISWWKAQQLTALLWDPTNTAHVLSIHASINENTLNTLQTANSISVWLTAMDTAWLLQYLITDTGSP